MVHADVRRRHADLSILKRARARASRQAGFTLIELIVVTAILTLVTSLVLVNNNRFGGRILLENLAYDVALTVREAQVYGISVRQFGSGNFAVGYGVHFTRGTEGDPATTFVLFADAVIENGIYDAGEIVGDTYVMERGFHVADLCARPAGAASEVCGLSSLDMLFRRPEPDAYISANGSSGIANPASLQERGRIILRSPREDQVSVVVEATGQISVE